VACMCRPILWPAYLERLLTNPTSGLLLMEDNAPSHNSNFTNSEREKAGVKKVEWPPNSPDFNPIEHIWRIMKARILRQRGEEQVMNSGQMRIILKEEWDRITVEDINHEIAKLPSIVSKCILQDGSNKFQA